MRATPIRTAGVASAPSDTQGTPRIVVQVEDRRSVQVARVEALPLRAAAGTEDQLDERERVILGWARANPGWRSVQELRHGALGGQSDGHKARKSVPGVLRRMQRLGLVECRGGEASTFEFRARGVAQ